MTVFVTEFLAVAGLVSALCGTMSFRQLHSRDILPLRGDRKKLGGLVVITGPIFTSFVIDGANRVVPTSS